MRGPLTAARLLTLFFFLLLVSICAYWLVQILAPRPAIAPSASIGDASAPANLEPATKLFGSTSGIRHLWRDAAMTLAVGTGGGPSINVTTGRAVGGSSILTGG